MGTAIIVIVFVTKFIVLKIWTTIKTVTSLFGFIAAMMKNLPQGSWLPITMYNNKNWAENMRACL